MTKPAKTEEERARNREYYARYRAAHPELKGYYAAYYRAHKEKWADANKTEAQREAKREGIRKWRRKNRDEINARVRQARAVNPGPIREAERKLRAKSRPQKRARDARYRAENAEKCNATIAAARSKKPELYRAIAVKREQARRAREKAALTESVDLNAILARDRGLCHLCRAPVDRKDRTFDHLIPVARHGAHAEWNLALAHRRCNQRRGTRQILDAETKDAALAYVHGRAELKASADLFD